MNNQVADLITEPPPKLFRFQSFNKRNLVALEAQTFWFSSVGHFNDPQEFFFRIHPAHFEGVAKSLHTEKDFNNAVKAGLASLEQLQNADQSGWESILDLLVSESRKFILENLNNLGVCCFFADRENVLYWSHYADSHYGFCIEVDAIPEKISNRTLAIVNYHDQPYEVNFDKLNDDVPDTASIVLTKSKYWAYENEWRFVDQSPNELKSIGSDVVSAIYFGCRMKDEHKRLLKLHTNNRLKYYDSQLSPESYKIQFTENEDDV